MPELDAWSEVVGQLAARVAEKLRQQHSDVAAVRVFVTTSPFRKRDRQHGASVTLPMLRPTSDTRLTVQVAQQALKDIHRPGFNDVKAGVMLVDLRTAGQTQQALALIEAPAQVEQALCAGARITIAMDALNRRFGKGSIGIAKARVPVLPKGYESRREWMSPQCTSRIEGVPMVL